MSSSGGERLLLEVGEEVVDLEARRLKDAPPELIRSVPRSGRTYLRRYPRPRKRRLVRAPQLACR
jgi:hypothetical protein